MQKFDGDDGSASGWPNPAALETTDLELLALIEQHPPSSTEYSSEQPLMMTNMTVPSAQQHLQQPDEDEATMVEQMFADYNNYNCVIVPEENIYSHHQQQQLSSQTFELELSPGQGTSPDCSFFS
uniref:NAC domain-containing protein n=1 Tax=Macrostomum lignano TaxID=282301 RepID=A0A1I8G7D3_9PLAT